MDIILGNVTSTAPFEGFTDGDPDIPYGMHVGDSSEGRSDLSDGINDGFSEI